MTIPSRNTRTESSTMMYQVECQMTKKGKMFAGSKRRVCWRFGFASREAIEAGQTGTACRGEEHEVVMVWSLTSGKQLVLADGHEVHWSKARAKMFDKFECNWQMAGGRQLSVVAHASTPLFDKKEDFRQFDLQINGVSFWDMPQMYELGNKTNAAVKHTTARPQASPNLRQVAPLELNTSMDDQYSVVSDIQATFYRSQPQLSALDAGLQTPRAVSPSPSMPDLLDFSSSVPSILDMATPLHHQNVPNTPGFTSSPPPARPKANPSPTSVMMNPFDVFASPTAGHHNGKAHFVQQHQYQQSPYHATYAPSPMANDPWSATQQQQRQQYFQQQQLLQHQHQQLFSPSAATAAQSFPSQPQPTACYAGY